MYVALMRWCRGSGMCVALNKSRVSPRGTFCFVTLWRVYKPDKCWQCRGLDREVLIKH